MVYQIRFHLCSKIFMLSLSYLFHLIYTVGQPSVTFPVQLVFKELHQIDLNFEVDFSNTGFVCGDTEPPPYDCSWSAQQSQEYTMAKLFSCCTQPFYSFFQRYYRGQLRYL